MKFKIRASGYYNLNMVVEANSKKEATEKAVNYIRAYDRDGLDLDDDDIEIDEGTTEEELKKLVVSCADKATLRRIAEVMGVEFVE